MVSKTFVLGNLLIAVGGFSCACSGEGADPPVSDPNTLGETGGTGSTTFGAGGGGGLGSTPPSGSAGSTMYPPLGGGTGGSTMYPPPGGGTGGSTTHPPLGGGGVQTGTGGVQTGTGGVQTGTGGVQTGTGGVQTGTGGVQTGTGGVQTGTGGVQTGTGGVQNGTGGTTVATGHQPAADKLPTVTGTCPDLKTGAATINGTALQLWVGTKPGPMYFYWHATGQTYTEVMQGMPGATAGVTTDGGIVASFSTTNKMGADTGNSVWFTGDFVTADQILACGIQKGLIDTSRIYTAGYSAGGLQACAMVAQRGKYLAAAICYSGGASQIGGTPQDKSNLPPTLLLHGGAGKDMFILDFNAQSHTWETAYVKAGGFAIDCDDGGDHITSAGTRMGFGGRAMPFFKDHPFNTKPEPYSPLPTTWPTYCQIAK
jgi:hypothetical protein